MEPIEDQATIIQRNVTRWQATQKAIKAKQAERELQAKQQLFKELGREAKPTEVQERITYILKERRAKWLLKEGRATIGEIVAAHKPKGKGE